MKNLIFLYLLSFCFLVEMADLQAATRSPASENAIGLLTLQGKRKKSISNDSRSVWVKQIKQRRKVRKKEKKGDPVQLIKESQQAWRLGLISFIVGAIAFTFSTAPIISLFPLVGMISFCISFFKAARAVRILKKRSQEFDPSLLSKAKKHKILGLFSALIPLSIWMGGVIYLLSWF